MSTFLFVLMPYSDNDYFEAVIEASGSGVADSGIARLVGISLALLSLIAVTIVSLAVVFFIWGMIKYTISQSEDDKKNARAIIVNGLIILFVMVSVWSLVAIIGRTLDINRITPASSGSSDNIKIFK